MSVPPHSKKHNVGSINWLRASTGKHAGNQHFIGIRAAQAVENGVEAMESSYSNSLTSLHTRCDEAAALEIGRSMRFVYPWKLELITTTRRDTFAARGETTTPLCSTSEIETG